MLEIIVNMTVKNQRSGKQHLTKPDVTPMLPKDGRKLAVSRYTKLVNQLHGQHFCDDTDQRDAWRLPLYFIP